MAVTGTGKLERTTFRTSRALEFCSRKELVAQTGHDPDEWPLVIAKELIDNGLDACEEAGVAPQIIVNVGKRGIVITDNGPGVTTETLDAVMDYTVRASSREAYVAPDRGAQGNALKTVLAMPFALDGERGRVDIVAHGQRHKITFEVDTIRQRPELSRVAQPAIVRNGTRVKVWWPQSACSQLQDSEDEFLQLVSRFALLNPHATLEVRWFGERTRFEATATDWHKWRPSDPTCPAWYSQEDFDRNVSAYIADDKDRGTDRSVREFISEFRGLAGTRKQKQVLEATGLARTKLSALANGRNLRRGVTTNLLEAMKANSKPVKPAALGTIGREHVTKRFDQLGCDLETFEYRKVPEVDGDGLPFVAEVAFAWCPTAEERCLITGVNWSGAIGNPFRKLNEHSLDGILEEQRAGPWEPVVLMVHLVTPRARYTDRGKSAIVVDDEKADAIVSAVKSATKKWARQRKAEDKEARKRANRRDALVRRKRVSIKDAARQVLPDAYDKASGPRRLPVKTRQLYYAARRGILELTGRDSLKTPGTTGHESSRSKTAGCCPSTRWREVVMPELETSGTRSSIS